jgi:hypothetical protein
MEEGEATTNTGSPSILPPPPTTNGVEPNKSQPLLEAGVGEDMGAPSLGDCDGGDHQLSLECLKLSKLRTGFSCNSKAKSSHTTKQSKYENCYFKAINKKYTHNIAFCIQALPTMAYNQELYFLVDTQ